MLCLRSVDGFSRDEFQKIGDNASPIQSASLVSDI